MTLLAPRLERYCVEHLGQSGLKNNADRTYILADPNLSYSVEELDSPELVRVVPIACSPSSRKKVYWALITHKHMDHCDPLTIPVLSEASRQAKCVAPEPKRRQLKEWGNAAERILEETAEWIELGSDLRMLALPAAHPHVLVDQDDQPKAVGSLLERFGKRVWLTGDTSICEELIRYLQGLMSIHVARLPVNEENYFRRGCGIVGNMSVRKACGLAAESRIKQVVPEHWDIFIINSTNPDKIESIDRAYDGPFRLVVNAGAVSP